MSASSQKSKGQTSNPYAIQQFNTANQKLGNSTYHTLDGSQINQFMNPYNSQVIDTMTARNNQNQQMALNANHDAAVRAGAFGGNGLDVADALTRGQFDLNNQQSIASLLNQGYSQALQAAQGENSAANQYPLAIQQLLGQLAQGTLKNSKDSSSKIGASWSDAAGFGG